MIDGVFNLSHNSEQKHESYVHFEIQIFIFIFNVSNTQKN